MFSVREMEIIKDAFYYKSAVVLDYDGYIYAEDDDTVEGLQLIPFKKTYITLDKFVRAVEREKDDLEEAVHESAYLVGSEW